MGLSYKGIETGQGVFCLAGSKAPGHKVADWLNSRAGWISRDVVPGARWVKVKALPDGFFLEAETDHGREQIKFDLTGRKLTRINGKTSHRDLNTDDQALVTSAKSAGLFVNTTYVFG